jgi:hypothetical protein
MLITGKESGYEEHANTSSVVYGISMAVTIGQTVVNLLSSYVLETIKNRYSHSSIKQKNTALSKSTEPYLHHNYP